MRVKITFIFFVLLLLSLNVHADNFAIIYSSDLKTSTTLEWTINEFTYNSSYELSSNIPIKNNSVITMTFLQNMGGYNETLDLSDFLTFSIDNVEYNASIGISWTLTLTSSSGATITFGFLELIQPVQIKYDNGTIVDMIDFYRSEFVPNNNFSTYDTYYAVESLNSYIAYYYSGVLKEEQHTSAMYNTSITYTGSTEYFTNQNSNSNSSNSPLPFFNPVSVIATIAVIIRFKLKLSHQSERI